MSCWRRCSPSPGRRVDEALAREGRWVGELLHTRKDGEMIVVASRQALQRDEDGQPIAIIELNSDITSANGRKRNSHGPPRCSSAPRR